MSFTQKNYIFFFGFSRWFLFCIIVLPKASWDQLTYRLSCSSTVTTWASTKKMVTHDSSVSLHLVPQRTHTSVCLLWHFSVSLHASYRSVKWVGQMSGFYNLYLVSEKVTHLTITCCGFIYTPGSCRGWMQPLEQLEECGLIKMCVWLSEIQLRNWTLAQSVIQPRFPSQRVWRSGSVAEQHHWRSVR